MLRLELLVHGRLIQLGREAVRNLATEVGTGYQGPRVKRGKVVFRFKGNRPKTVPGRYGTVTVKRAYYASGSGEIRVPLDEQQWRARLRQGGAAVIDELGRCATLTALTATIFNARSTTWKRTASA